MKQRMIIFAIAFLWSLNAQTQGALLGEGESRAADDSTSSFLGGLYGTYPILNESERIKWKEKKE